MSFVYKQTEPELWTVGHYAYGQRWLAESDHSTPEAAADRASYLNGTYLSGIGIIRQFVERILERAETASLLKAIHDELGSLEAASIQDLYPQGTEGEEP